MIIIIIIIIRILLIIQQVRRTRPWAIPLTMIPWEMQLTGFCEYGA